MLLIFQSARVLANNTLQFFYVMILAAANCLPERVWFG
jgi:hypothetical protein